MSETTISAIRAREILDSRGNPTIRAYVSLRSGVTGKASIPSGASTGKYEALELRDNDSSRFLGKGVLKAVANVNDVIAPALIGFNARDQDEIDGKLKELDGTPLKKNLGANAILSVSMAVAQAASQALGVPLYAYLGKRTNYLLPVPLINILNGGSHADNNVDFQEFMIVPVNSHTFSDAIRMGAEVFHHLKKILKERGYSTAVGDEGGFAPDLKSNEEALELIMESIDKTGFKAGKDIYLALDVAASELFQDKKYTFEKSGRPDKSNEQMVDLYENLVQKYPIISVEDGLGEDDWEGWAVMTERLGGTIQIVGDDIFVTNLERFKKGVAQRIGNSILIKLNQIGTLSETVEVMAYAQKESYSTVISHRSGETEDAFIADLSVALNSGQIKTGSLSRSERVAKYNRLLEIEEELDDKGSYAGAKVFSRYIS